MAYKVRFSLVTLSLVVIGLIGAFMLPQTAHAGSAAGPGGGNGSVSPTCNKYNHSSPSCPWTTNGPFGWRIFSVNDVSPNVPDGNGIWPSAKLQCTNAGASQVIAFVMYTGTRTIQGAWIYKYNSAKLTTGFTVTYPYITISDAASRFSSIGYTGPLKFGTDVGWFCYGTAENWTVSGQSSVTVTDKSGYNSGKKTGVTTTASPGQTLSWAHTLTNNGPTDMKKSVNYNVTLNNTALFSPAGFNNVAPISPAISGTASGVNGSTFVDTTNGSYQTYYVQAGDVGKTLCQQIDWNPSASTNTVTSTSSPACVQIPYNYSLTPNTNVDLSGTVEAGSVVGVTPTITNAGPTNSPSVQWQVTQLVVQPGASVPNVGGGTSPTAITPCGTYFKNLPQATCSTVASGNSAIGVSGSVISGSPLSTSSVVVGDYPVGTKVCYATSVQPYASTTSDWRHSAPVCLIVGIKPKVQITGGDLVANSVNSSTTLKSFSGNQFTFGSWIEYGIFAVGNITGAASGSAYAGSGLANATNCNESQLSFANSTSSGSCSTTTVIGDYTNAPSIPDVSASFTATGAPSIGSGDLAVQSQTGVFTTSGVTLSGGNIQKGRWVVINAPTADITINGDITYDNGTLHSLADIPQVVIIANNINITGNVKQIDAWLVAKSGINTCSDVTGNLSSTLCNNQLVVNGPVMAKTLYLRRTAGSGTGANHSGDPAEIFNLRPDAYMWASQRATGSGNRVQTVYTTELPPRL